MSDKKPCPVCETPGKCFGRTKTGKCKILTDTTEYRHECPFQKDKVDVTNGVWYPWDPGYGKS